MPLDLDVLPNLGKLFKLLLNGSHINRRTHATLWLELENQQAAYDTLFDRLGYQLKVDGRGFAWFHYDDLTSSVTQQSRQLALLFMVLFDTQADNGRSLARFDDWVIDDALLEQVIEQHKDVLKAENIDLDALKELLNKAAGLGFALREDNQWFLLPPVYRYLDHFEALMAAEQAAERALADELEDDDANPTGDNA